MRISLVFFNANRILSSKTSHQGFLFRCHLKIPRKYFVGIEKNIPSAFSFFLFRLL
jgi:hypothetical protein